MKRKRYISLFEDIKTEDINKALKNMINILSRRLGKEISIPSMVMDYSNSDGNFTGIRCIVGDNQAIRFNWKSSGNSSKIESISFWFRPNEQPDVELEVGEYNLIQILDVIIQVFENKSVGEYITEKVSPATKGVKSIIIAKTINQWKDDSEITEYELENERMISLYNDFTFWYSNLSDENVKNFSLVSKSAFISYLQKAMEKLNIENKFARKIKVTKARQEIMKVSKSDSSKFKKQIYELSLEDKMEMIRMGVQAVTQGFTKARLYTGTAGIGKTHTVLDELKDAGAKYKHISGGIKNARALYQILYDNNDPNLVIVFDDVNNILKNKEAIEILRVAVTNEKVRTITYVDTKIQKGSRKYKPELDFKSAVIIITNIPKKKIDSAITSRTNPIEINVNPDEILDSIRINLEKAPPPAVDVNVKMEVWEFLKDELGVNEIKQIDYRVFADIMLWKLASGNSNKWKKFAYQIVH